MTASTPTYEDAHGEDPSSGILRASVFGASDGLVSNLGVVVGVGAASASSGPVLVAGIAALVAGAFSMAAGEYVSMRTQREVLERELAVESDHIAEHPGEEEAHLAELLADNGLDSATARHVAAEVHREQDAALEFHARFELGIDPSSLGSPLGAAAGSFLAFVAGAAVPVVPYLFSAAAMLWAIVVSMVGLAGLGAWMTRFTGQRWWFGAGRQLVIGALAAAVTYGIGTAVGTAV
ncbi:MAG: VIT1/CCC1 transporter family protein [Acidimicrobiia bacterium]|nr:VIT1/CCC1 transporter family protein [Acidimicrobiia bacterium]